MCELFSINAKNKILINDDLKKFYSDCDLNPHGWGFGLINDDKTITIKKEPKKSSESIELKKILSKPIHTTCTLVHIRLATRGNMNQKNCHPFSYKDKNNTTWMLIHNGTIFNYQPLEKYEKIQKGSTDSERILLYIIDNINKVDKKDYFNLLDTLISKLAEKNKLNLMFYNENILYIHTNCKDGIHYLESDDKIIFTTKKCNKQWKTLPINTLFAVSNGKIIKKGKPHKHEFHITEENKRLMLKHTPVDFRDIVAQNFNIEHIEEYI